MCWKKPHNSILLPDKSCTLAPKKPDDIFLVNAPVFKFQKLEVVSTPGIWGVKNIIQVKLARIQSLK